MTVMSWETVAAVLLGFPLLVSILTHAPTGTGPPEATVTRIMPWTTDPETMTLKHDFDEHGPGVGKSEVDRFLISKRVPAQPDGTAQSAQDDLSVCLATCDSPRRCLLDYVRALDLVDDAFYSQMVHASNTSILLTPYGRQQHENLTYDDIAERYQYYRAFRAHEVNASGLVNLTRMVETCGRFAPLYNFKYTMALEFDGYIPTANLSSWLAAEFFAHNRYVLDFHHGNYTLADVLFYVDFMRWAGAFITSPAAMGAAIADVFFFLVGCLMFYARVVEFVVAGYLYYTIFGAIRAVYLTIVIVTQILSS